VHVIVVGAGIVGYAIAYELAARGVRVEVIDPRGSGQGATRASAGILAPYIEGHSGSLLRLGTCSLEQYDRFIERVSADARQPIEYRRVGTLQVALDSDQAQQLEAEARTLAAAGVPHSLIDTRSVRQIEKALAPEACAGLLVPQHGYVAAGALTAALSTACARRGATLIVDSVRAVRENGGAVTVECADDTRAADAAVIAAGSWSGRIAVPPVALPVRPVRGQLLQLRVPQASLSPVLWGPGCYLVPWQDGTVLVGATSEDVDFDESVTAGGVRELLTAAERLIPSLTSASFVDARAGLRPATPDELPIIGPSSTMAGVYYATGHYRNGVLLAPLTATLIADLLTKGQAHRELDLVRPNRFGL
jgi:glycine oxidase